MVRYLPLKFSVTEDSLTAETSATIKNFIVELAQIYPTTHRDDLPLYQQRENNVFKKIYYTDIDCQNACAGFLSPSNLQGCLNRMYFLFSSFEMYKQPARDHYVLYLKVCERSHLLVTLFGNVKSRPLHEKIPGPLPAQSKWWVKRMMGRGLGKRIRG